MSPKLTITDKVLFFPLWLISLLPLSVLYAFSDILYYLVFYIIRYRRKVVGENLRQSFPEKETADLRSIEKGFYRNLCDYFMESLYLLNMSIGECKKRYSYTNPELIQDLHKKGKSLAIATSHTGNWEWAANFPQWFPYPFYGIYKPLRSKRFNRLLYHLRYRYGCIPIPMKQTLRTISDCIKKKEIFALYFVADQRPRKKEIQFWTTFFNQETPVFTGMDRLARKYDLAVVFMNITRKSRGYYQVSYELITDQASLTAENEIITEYMGCVEKLVRRQPELYLWSHNRWKHKPEPKLS